MKKDKKRQLPDTPFQFEFLRMAENDERRDCRWCIYRDNKNQWCEELNATCTGSSQCNFYKKRDDNFIPIKDFTSRNECSYKRIIISKYKE